MRLWSLHPSLLDRRALVALWREGLLARHVLNGQTKGYTNHPQLARFKACPTPLAAIDAFLHEVVDEAERRNYRFDRSKLGERALVDAITVTDGQLAYEWKHLLAKLEVRDQGWLEKVKNKPVLAHPSLQVITGPIENWERV